MDNRLLHDRRMENIPIPDFDVVPLDSIADGVVGIRIVFVNVFGIEVPGGDWVLVDAGLPMSGSRIRDWVDSRFGRPPNSIILTHGHFDHVGVVKELADEWDVPIYAHELEAPFLTGREKYPPPDWTSGGGLMALLSPLYPRGPIDVSHRLRFLSGDGRIADLPGWKWIHTPGHTVGHISLFREEDRLLLPADAFCTTNAASFVDAVATQKPELSGPPPYYTPDWNSAKASVQKLAALRPAVVAPGHGMPMQGAEFEQGLQVLAENFDRIARPHHSSAA